MNFTLDLLILKKDFEQLGLNEQLVNWGDEKLSQNPPRYTNGSKLIFEWCGDLKYYKEYFSRFIPDSIVINQFEALRLVGNSMFELERLINYEKVPINNLLGNEIISFLNKLSKVGLFIIFLIRDEEYIDMKYELQDDSELAHIFYECVSYSISKGAVIFKK